MSSANLALVTSERVRGNNMVSSFGFDFQSYQFSFFLQYLFFKPQWLLGIIALKRKRNELLKVSGI